MMKKIILLSSICVVCFVGFSQNTNYKLYIDIDDNNNGCLRYDLFLNGVQISSSKQSSDFSMLMYDSESISVHFENLNDEELHIAINEFTDEMVLKVKEIYFAFSSLNKSVDVAPISKFKNLELLSFQNPSNIDVWLFRSDSATDFGQRVPLKKTMQY